MRTYRKLCCIFLVFIIILSLAAVLPAESFAAGDLASAPSSQNSPELLKATKSVNLLNSISSLYFADTGLRKPDVKVSVSSTKVKLSWSKVAGASGYQIYRATGKNGKYKKIKTTTKTSYNNSGLKSGKIYYYKIRAYSKTGGKKKYSKYCKVYAAPLGVPVCKCSAMITANRIRTNGVTGATGYAVYRADSTNGKYAYLGKTKSLYFDDRSAKVGHVYFYYMTAYVKSGGTTVYGPHSYVARGSKLLEAPKTKVALAEDPGDPGVNEGIRVTWTSVPAAEGYEVWRSADNGKHYNKIFSGNRLEYVDTTCKEGAIYYYKVRGFRHVYGVLDYGYSSPSKHSRDAVVEQIEKWKGYTRSNGKYKKIVDIYNNYRPLPRDMKGGYGEAWCTTTVTAAAIKTGLVDIMPRERICRYMISLYEELGLWVEKDSYVPKKGDLIMYSWQDSGAGDCKLDPKHIGVVVSVKNGKIKVIEGNQNGKVAYRTVNVNGRYIRGFATPKYDVNNGIRFTKSAS